MGSEMDKKGILRKEDTKEVLDEVLSRGKYKEHMDNERLTRVDKLKIVNSALTDIHLAIVGSGRVSTTEAKNFRHFVKRQMDSVIKARPGEKEKAGEMLGSVVWEAYEAYIRFKLGQIDDIKRKKAARVQRIMEKADRRRKA